LWKELEPACAEKRKERGSKGERYERVYLLLLRPVICLSSFKDYLGVDFSARKIYYPTIEQALLQWLFPRLVDY
jgi:hypothetical protein